MEYRVRIGASVTSVEVDTKADQPHITVTLEDRTYHVNYRVMNDHLLRLEINGKWVQAFFTPQDQGTRICINGKTFLVQDADHLARHRRSSGGAEDTAGEITPPMPAIVLRILVQEGDAVKKGRGLVVLSAMKMETTLSAPRDGTILRINTSVDERVAPGEILIEMAP